ncbi:hypothetical protein PAPYR_3792 [Paratrimastix pyriformis]|uniref:Uncharacterized protein n=1 Tax=Paratrimastix pyriformis TaxID=342808 RepID=A0ABQ8UNN7_9EUKA|nr:hypothetical protein PAPYR_3792 [Paratrimastix pyriformis]
MGQGVAPKWAPYDFPPFGMGLFFLTLTGKFEMIAGHSDPKGIEVNLAGNRPHPFPPPDYEASAQGRPSATATATTTAESPPGPPGAADIAHRLGEAPLAVVPGIPDRYPELFAAGEGEESLEAQPPPDRRSLRRLARLAALTRSLSPRGHSPAQSQSPAQTEPSERGVSPPSIRDLTARTASASTSSLPTIGRRSLDFFGRPAAPSPVNSARHTPLPPRSPSPPQPASSPRPTTGPSANVQRINTPFLRSPRCLEVVRAHQKKAAIAIFSSPLSRPPREKEDYREGLSAPGPHPATAALRWLPQYTRQVAADRRMGIQIK